MSVANSNSYCSEQVRRLRNISNLFSNGSVNMGEREQESACKCCKMLTLVGSSNGYININYVGLSNFL